MCFAHRKVRCSAHTGIFLHTSTGLDVQVNAARQKCMHRPIHPIQVDVTIASGLHKRISNGAIDNDPSHAIVENAEVCHIGVDHCDSSSPRGRNVKRGGDGPAVDVHLS